MKKMIRKLNSIILVIALTVSVMPLTGLTVYADETETDTPAAASGSDSNTSKDEEKPANNAPKNDEKQAGNSNKENKKPAADSSKDMEKPADETHKDEDKPAETTPKEDNKPSSDTPKEEEKPSAEAPKDEEKPAESAPKEDKPSSDTPKDEEKPSDETPKDEEKPTESAPKEEDKPSSDTPKEEEKPSTETPEDEEKPSETNPEDKEKPATETPDDNDQPSSDTPEDDGNKEITVEKGPDENVTQDPKDAFGQIGTIDNVKITNGTLSWNPYLNAGRYYLYISGYFAYDYDQTDPYEISLKNLIDYSIKNGDIANSSTYSLELVAISEADGKTILAKWTGTYSYNSSATPIQTGTISGVNFANGTMTWNAFSGTDHYEIYVSNVYSSWVDNDDRSLSINKAIDRLIRQGDIEKNSPYTIEIRAINDEYYTIAKWNGSYSYDSSVIVGQPETIENVKISNGIISWDPCDDGNEYILSVSGCYADSMNSDSIYYSGGSYSFELNKSIDHLIKNGELSKNSTYSIELIATSYADDNITVARWTGTYSYNSSATPIQVDTISGVNFANGTMTWNAFSGTDHYEIYISNVYSSWAENNDRTLKINKEIDRLIRQGDIENSSPYTIEIRAIDDEYCTIARWNGSYSYDSSVTVGQPEAIENVKISNGTISWDPLDDPFYYTLLVSGRYAASVYTDDVSFGAGSYSFNLNAAIDFLIKNGEISKSSTYTLELKATSDWGENATVSAKWTGSYSYESSATPIQVGTISGVNFTNGTMTWNAFSGADNYEIYISGYDLRDFSNLDYYLNGRSLRIKSVIEQLVTSEEIEDNNSYAIEIKAIDSDGYTIARWSGSYSDESVDLSNATVTGIEDKTFTGSAITQTLTVVLNDKTLVENTDYTVSYTNNINVGEATVTITGNGIYFGTIIKTFNIKLSENVLAAGNCGTNLTWTLSTDGTLTISGNGAMSYSGDAPWSDYKNQIRSVVFDGEITSIGEGAFLSCENIKSITIPQSVTAIDNYAFGICTGLTSITIPNTVTSIGNQAFGDCSGLTSVTIPESVNSIGNQAFFNCTNLTSVTISGTVTSNNAYTFANIFTGCTKLKNVIIHDGETSISDNAFYGCTSITSITLPDSLTSIGGYAFGGCANLSSITLPNSLTSIGEGAFISCESLKSITIPSGVTTIKKYTFGGCLGLTSVTIPNTVTSIGEFAFDYCSSLTSISIPKSVKTIGDAAFRECINLSSVTISGTVTSNTSLADVFKQCTKLKNVIIHDGETSISDNAFYGCTSITSITLPDSLTSIGGYAFGGCANLSSITLPDSLTSIGEGAFISCESLKSIAIPNGVTSIEKYTFGGCSGLTSVTIPETVTSIGDFAFDYCSSLTSITIPDSVKTIGDAAFRECNALTAVVMNKAAYSNSAFPNLSASDIHYYYNISYKNEGSGIITGEKTRTYGTDVVKITITPTNNSVLEKVTLTAGDKTFDLSPDASGNYTMPDIDTNDTAVIKAWFAYTITVNKSTNGTATVDISTAAVGNEITITTTPDTGYEVDTIKVNNTVIDKPSFTMPDENVTITVTFKKIMYTVTVSETTNGKAVVDKTSAGINDTVTLTITPDTGYELDEIKVNNGTAFTDPHFTMDAGDATVTVTFKKIQYTISVSQANNGSATASKDKAGIGDEITVTATPDKGYYLSAVKVNGNPIEGTTFPMPTENVTVEVEFSEQLDNTLTVKGGKTASVKYKKLRKKAQSVSRSKVMSVSNAQGKVTYSLVSVSKKKYKKYFKINANTGAVTVKKKLRKGKYTIKCKVIAAGDDEHKSITKTVSFKIKVK